MWMFGWISKVVFFFWQVCIEQVATTQLIVKQHQMNTVSLGLLERALWSIWSQLFGPPEQAQIFVWEIKSYFLFEKHAI